jgi:ABC-type antimicrobial peptide transport system permease subunit
MRAVAFGATIGMMAWLSLGQSMRGIVREWSPDSADVSIAAAVLAVAAVIGCLIPARRALSIDPGQALRSE